MTKRTAEMQEETLRKLQAQGPMNRAAEIISEAIDQEARTVSLAFSSEEPYERWFGIEVLGHEPHEVMLDRLNDGAAVLVGHDWDDHVGIVEKVELGADRVARAVVRFGRSARASEIFQDIVDGIRKHVSVGYSVKEWQLVGEKDGTEIYRMTKWQPHEISIVSVPADTTVGVGRELEKPQEEQRAAEAENHPIHTPFTKQEPPKMDTPIVDVGAERQAATAQERARVRSIVELGEKFGHSDLARDAIKEGKSPEEFQRQLLDAVNERMNRPLQEQAAASDVGLTDKEVRQFSFIKVIRALTDPTDTRAQKAAAFEFEVSRAAAEKAGKDGERFMVPTDVLRRALNTSTAGGVAGNTGGFSVATDLQAASFIEILRNRATIMRKGRVLAGLVGNLDIPKQTAAAQGFWLGEDATATESNLELGQISLAPKTVAAFSEITRKLMQQSSLDVEALVRADLAMALALTIDKAGYYGTGSTDQPKGIANYTGINAVSFAAVQPTFAELVAMETQVALDNADVESLSYVANANFRGHAKTTEKFANSGQTIWEPGNTVNGYSTEITNQITTGDVFMGNFADLLVGLWGGLELTVDPYTHSTKGRLRVVVFQDVDFALRRVESFCLGKKPAV